MRHYIFNCFGIFLYEKNADWNKKNHLKFLFLEQHLAEEIVQGKIVGIPLYDKKKRDRRKNTKIGYVERFFLT